MDLAEVTTLLLIRWVRPTVGRWFLTMRINPVVRDLQGTALATSASWACPPAPFAVHLVAGFGWLRQPISACRGGAGCRHSTCCVGVRGSSCHRSPPVARVPKKKWRLFSCQVWRLFSCHTQMDFNMVRWALRPRTAALVGRTPSQPTTCRAVPWGVLAGPA